MADIASKVASIRQAVYGKDVRESIASGIEAINEEVVDTTSRQNVIDAQEQSRINAENIRVTRENDRINKENIRQLQESIRQEQENSRQLNESNRQTTFETNETNRTATFGINENDRQTQFNLLKTGITDSINDATTAANNANEATSNYGSVIEDSKKIYKEMATSLADLAVKYPTPEIGWTVVTEDTNIEYRWDGIEWVPIGVLDTFVGFGVIVSSTTPTNPNLIWLDAPETTKYARIYPSETEPADHNQLWWEQD